MESQHRYNLYNHGPFVEGPRGAGTAMGNMYSPLVRVPKTHSAHFAFIYLISPLGDRSMWEGKRVLKNNCHPHPYNHHQMAPAVEATEAKWEDRGCFLMSFLLFAEDSFSNRRACLENPHCPLLEKWRTSALPTGRA